MCLVVVEPGSTIPQSGCLTQHLAVGAATRREVVQEVKTRACRLLLSLGLVKDPRPRRSVSMRREYKIERTILVPLRESVGRSRRVVVVTIVPASFNRLSQT